MFAESFRQFLEENRVRYLCTDGSLFSFEGADVKIRLVNVDGFEPVVRTDGGTIYLFEDRWNRGGGQIRSRILSHLGIFRSVFARNCRIERMDTPTANDFLNRYHTYGAARSKYRYGLFCREELVAVASFSSGRPMLREDKVVDSYEWVRYASLPDTRVAGGMGKILDAFCADIHPEEIMSYADLEWSDGSVYRTLGFSQAGFRAPVEFYVNTQTWERVSAVKIQRDRAYMNRSVTDGFVKISNLGSIKFLKRLSF